MATAPARRPLPREAGSRWPTGSGSTWSSRAWTTCARWWPPWRGCPWCCTRPGRSCSTSEPMVQACLATRAHYLDITGELPVFENTFHHDAEARERGITLMSGVGFDVVPTDCLARYVAERVPGAHELDWPSPPEARPAPAPPSPRWASCPRVGACAAAVRCSRGPWARACAACASPTPSAPWSPFPGETSSRRGTPPASPTSPPIWRMPRGAARFLRVTYPAAQAGARGGRRPPRRRAPHRVARARPGRAGPQREPLSHLGRGPRRGWPPRSGLAGSPRGLRLHRRGRRARCGGDAGPASPRGSQTPARAFGADFVLSIPGCLRLEVLP